MTMSGSNPATDFGGQCPLLAFLNTNTRSLPIPIFRSPTSHRFMHGAGGRDLILSRIAVRSGASRAPFALCVTIRPRNHCSRAERDAARDDALRVATDAAV
jgi:hypothetical protein